MFTRVKITTFACRSSEIITCNIQRADIGATGQPGFAAADAAELIESHDCVLNAITQKLPNSIFTKYMEKEHVNKILDGLKDEYGTSIAASEAWTEEPLFSLKCHDDRKLQNHLDDLSDLKNKLAKIGITQSLTEHSKMPLLPLFQSPTHQSSQLIIHL
jgi:hypothetical protein